jgi:hypothetical protein
MVIYEYNCVSHAPISKMKCISFILVIYVPSHSKSVFDYSIIKRLKSNRNSKSIRLLE